MRFARHAAAAAVAAAMGFGPANAAEITTIAAEKARFYFGGLYPAYSLFLKGIPDGLEDGWVDRPYYAVLDVHGGPEEGQSAILILTVSSDASPQPEWCVTEGAGEFGGHGPTLAKFIFICVCKCWKYLGTSASVYNNVYMSKL